MSFEKVNYATPNVGQLCNRFLLVFCRWPVSLHVTNNDS